MTETLLVGFAVLFVGFVALGLAGVGQTVPGKVEGMGDLNEQTRSEVLRVLGRPKKVLRGKGGVERLVWEGIGYRVEIRFRGEECLGQSR